MVCVHIRKVDVIVFAETSHWFIGVLIINLLVNFVDYN